MAPVRLPQHCTIDALAKQLGQAGAFGGDWESQALFFPQKANIHCSALTFLCAWGRQQHRAGHRLLFRGNEATQQNLARLGLQEHLGLAYEKRRRQREVEHFVPLRLILNEQDIVLPAQAIHDLIRHHFENATDFLPAVDWAVSEILDNVLRHADATEPGAIYAEYFPREHRLDIAICDLGRGIYASLGEAMALWSHGHAVTTALRRGVTRSEDIGQGNGLAGVLEIVTKNHGGMLLWTGDVVYRVDRGEEKGFVQIPEIPGTGVSFSLDTWHPVDLTDTWIASTGVSPLVDDNTARFETTSPINIASECSHTGTRAPAQRLRLHILHRLSEQGGPVTLNFTGVTSASSSFLDELLGRLAYELGRDGFREKVKLTGLSGLIVSMANVVINQRLGDNDPSAGRQGTAASSPQGEP
jgi:STAS-like domain of unknown function (DUF4325)